MSKICTVDLDEDEARYLSDVLDIWLDGYEAATVDVQNDRSLDDPEDMLRAIEGMHKHFDLGTSIKCKLQETEDVRATAAASAGLG